MNALPPKTISGLEVIDWEGKPPGFTANGTSNLFANPTLGDKVLRSIVVDVPLGLIDEFQLDGIDGFLEKVDQELQDAIQAVSEVMPCRVAVHEWKILNLLTESISPADEDYNGREFCDTFSLDRNFCLGALIERVSGTNYLKSPNLTQSNYNQSLDLLSALRSARNTAAKNKGWYIYDIYRLPQFIINDDELVLVDIEPHVSPAAELSSWPELNLNEEDDCELAYAHGVEIEHE